MKEVGAKNSATIFSPLHFAAEGLKQQQLQFPDLGWIKSVQTLLYSIEAKISLYMQAVF